MVRTDAHLTDEQLAAGYFVDGHLDLAYNALAAGRDLLLTLDALREQPGHETALVTLPELGRAGVRVVFGTIFVLPAHAVRVTAGGRKLSGRAYETPQEARALGLAQLEFYERLEDAGHIRLLRTGGDLEGHLAADAEEAPTGVVLLLEGADPLLSPGDLGAWVARGLRLVGPAWQRTRYAGGTKAPGPLTDLGTELIHAMNHHGVILDVSHLAEESFWGALELDPEHAIASHSNARALLPTDRHLSDEMIRALGARGGVIGLVLANAFLNPEATTPSPKEATTLAHLRRHAHHVAKLTSWEQVAVGSDFDGGFGVLDVPAEISRAADFAKLGEAVPEAARAGFLGENWVRFLLRALPS